MGWISNRVTEGSKYFKWAFKDEQEAKHIVTSLEANDSGNLKQNHEFPLARAKLTLSQSITTIIPYNINGKQYK